MLSEKLSAAADADPQTCEGMLQELANSLSDAELKELTSILISDDDLAEVTAMTIKIIGYPRNAGAIPVLLSRATDPNSPGALDAYEALAAIPPSAVAPHAIAMFWERGISNQWWANQIHVLSYVLCRLGLPYAEPCGPVVAYLLSQRPAIPDVPVSSLLRVLEVIGPAQSAYAVPLLLDLAHDETDEKFRVQAEALLAMFDEQTRALYAQI